MEITQLLLFWGTPVQHTHAPNLVPSVRRCLTVARQACLATCLLAGLAAPGLAGSITGAWWGCCGQAEGVFATAFLPNSEYVHLERGNSFADPSGQSGMERGTYTSDAVTGAFSVTTLLDTNGEWGFSDGKTNFASASGNVLTVASPEEGSFSLARLVDPNSPLVGAWFYRDSPEPGDLVMVAFLPNGEFLVGIDPIATGFIEYGTYIWDPSTGALQAKLKGNTAPPALTLRLPRYDSAVITDGQLTLSGAAGTVTFHGVTTPEPANALLTLAGLLLLAGPVAKRFC